MVAKTTDEILRELDLTPGGPVQFEDPRTRAQYVLIPHEAYRRVQPFLEPAKPMTGDAAVEWNEEKNARRFELIDREIAGTITLEEAADSERFQQEMYAYRERVAPLSLDDLRKQHAELLEKAARAEGYR